MRRREFLFEVDRGPLPGRGHRSLRPRGTLSARRVHLGDDSVPLLTARAARGTGGAEGGQRIGRRLAVCLWGLVGEKGELDMQIRPCTPKVPQHAPLANPRHASASQHAKHATKPRRHDNCAQNVHCPSDLLVGDFRGPLTTRRLRSGGPSHPPILLQRALANREVPLRGSGEKCHKMVRSFCATRRRRALVVPAASSKSIAAMHVDARQVTRARRVRFTLTHALTQSLTHTHARVDG